MFSIFFSGNYILQYHVFCVYKYTVGFLTFMTSGHNFWSTKLYCNLSYYADIVANQVGSLDTEVTLVTWQHSTSLI